MKFNISNVLLLILMVNVCSCSMVKKLDSEYSYKGRILEEIKEILASGNTNGVIKILESFICEKGIMEEPEISVNLGAIYICNGRVDEGKKILLQMEKYFRNAEVYEFIGICYMYERNYDDALRYFEKARCINPHSPRLLTRIAMCKFLNGETNEAKNELLYICNRFSDYAPSWFNMAVIHEKGFDDISSAANCYKKYVRITSDRIRKTYAETRLKNINVKIEVEEKVSSMDLQRKLHLIKNFKEVILKQIDNAVSNEEYDYAIVMLKRYVDSDAIKDAAIENLIYVYEKCGLFNRAVEMCDRYIMYFPDGEQTEEIKKKKSALLPFIYGKDDKTIRVLNILYEAEKKYKNGDIDIAARYYEQAILLDRNCKEAWYYLGLIKFVKSDFPEAKKCFENVISIGGSSPEILYMIGLVSIKERRIYEAIRYLREAISINPDFAKAYYSLSKLYSSIGDMNNAREYMDKYNKLVSR